MHELVRVGLAPKLLVGPMLARDLQCVLPMLLVRTRLRARATYPAAFALPVLPFVPGGETSTLLAVPPLAEAATGDHTICSPRRGRQRCDILQSAVLTLEGRVHEIRVIREVLGRASAVRAGPETRAVCLQAHPYSLVQERRQLVA